MKREVYFVLKLALSSIIHSSAFKWLTFTFIILIIFSVHSAWKKRKIMRQNVSKCASSKNKKIFVALISENGFLVAAESLHNIFSSASCPHNVFVGMHEIVLSDPHIEKRNSLALKEFIKLSKSYALSGNATDYDFSAHVTSAIRLSTDESPVGAILDLINYEASNKNYDYVLTLSDGVRMMDNWDLKLMNQSASYQKTVFVMNPENSPSFSSFGGFIKDAPIINRYPIVEKGQTSQNVCAKFFMWECSFAPMSFWCAGTENQIKNGTCSLSVSKISKLFSGYELLITIESKKRGWKLEHPFNLKLCTFLPQTLNSKRWAKHFKTSSSVKNYYLKKLFDGENEIILKSLGITKQKIEPHGILGMCNESNMDEKIQKFGSVADYDYIKTRFDRMQ